MVVERIGTSAWPLLPIVAGFVQPRTPAAARRLVRDLNARERQRRRRPTASPLTERLNEAEAERRKQKEREHEEREAILREAESSAKTRRLDPVAIYRNRNARSDGGAKDRKAQKRSPTFASSTAEIYGGQGAAATSTLIGATDRGAR